MIASNYYLSVMNPDATTLDHATLIYLRHIKHRSCIEQCHGIVRCTPLMGP